MIVREKRTGEEFSLPLKLELYPPYSVPGPDWDFDEDSEKRVRFRNKKTGEIMYPSLESRWCLHVPELRQTEGTGDPMDRHDGTWSLVAPGDDDNFEFVPESDDEWRTLAVCGFTIGKRHEQSVSVGR
jgi:hypothetical protein